eukprot:4112090-Alexandrium_andersonii.AAC.1
MPVSPRLHSMPVPPMAVPVLEVLSFPNTPDDCEDPSSLSHSEQLPEKPCICMSGGRARDVPVVP